MHDVLPFRRFCQANQLGTVGIEMDIERDTALLRAVHGRFGNLTRPRIPNLGNTLASSQHYPRILGLCLGIAKEEEARRPGVKLLEEDAGFRSSEPQVWDHFQISLQHTGDGGCVIHKANTSAPLNSCGFGGCVPLAAEDSMHDLLNASSVALIVFE